MHAYASCTNNLSRGSLTIQILLPTALSWLSFCSIMLNTPFSKSLRHNARVAKCQVTRLVVVNPTPLLEPLVLKRAIHNFSFSKLTLWKLEMHRLVLAVRQPQEGMAEMATPIADYRTLPAFN